MEVKNISNEEYHDSEGLSASAIKLLLECPRKYYWRYIQKRKPKQTAAMLEGSGFHEYILEPYNFKKSEWKEEKLVQFEQMKQSLYSLKTVNAMLSEGEPEISIFWKDKETDVLLKTRPDYLSKRFNTVFDLKTTCDGSREGFSRSIHNFGYHIQAAMAIDGLKNVFGEDYNVVNLVIEKSEPFCAAAYLLDDIAIDMGRKMYKKGIQIYLECTRNNFWPSYTYYNEAKGKEEIEIIGLPFWAENKFLSGE